MRRACAVNHASARLFFKRLRKRKVDPVVAYYPSSIILKARGFEPAAHRQKVFYGDGFLPGIGIFGKVFGEKLANGLIYTFQEALFYCNPNQQRQYTL